MDPGLSLHTIIWDIAVYGWMVFFRFVSVQKHAEGWMTVRPVAILFYGPDRIGDPRHSGARGDNHCRNIIGDHQYDVARHYR